MQFWTPQKINEKFLKILIIKCSKKWVIILKINNWFYKEFWKFINLPITKKNWLKILACLYKEIKKISYNESVSLLGRSSKSLILKKE